MSAEEYVPSDQDMRWQYAVKRMHDGATRTHAEREYTRWLAAHDARVQAAALRASAHSLSWFGAQGNTLDHLSAWGVVQTCMCAIEGDADRIEKEQNDG